MSQQRLLIVVHGRSQFKVIKLDRSFGGSGDRAEVSIPRIQETVRRLINVNGRSTCMSIANGLKDGSVPSEFWLTYRNMVRFHHSIVVSLCNEDQHASNNGTLHENFVRLETRSLRTSIRPVTTIPANNSDAGKITVDLHTKTALIGRLDQHVTLDYLRLDEEVTNGYIDIYAVPRQMDNENTFDVGKEAVYRLANCWVPLLTGGNNGRNMWIQRSRTRIMLVFYAS
jgi:hypothetical protein